ncbi:MAG: hypothetical protein HY823_05200 [Acidobacteria bacterium]|nr:hypothetical protein [Acidobacteriota bacterium]
MKFTLLRGLLGAALAASLLQTSCVDPSEGGGSTSGTSLYVFDGADSPASGRIRVWNDANTLFTNPAALPDRTLSGAFLDNVQVLGWGGMAMDTASNKLYLVSEAGDVVRIERVRSQNGSLSASTDIVKFSLGNGSTDRLAGSKFSQVSFDPQTNTLYAMETGDSDTRVWVVANPGSYGINATVTRQTVGVAGDKRGSGVAAAQGNLLAYFDDGNPVVNAADQTQYTGPRLRKGSASGFLLSGYPLVGTSKTQLRAYGALAYDTGNSQVFLARHLVDTGAAGPAVLVFKIGQFTSGLDQAPNTSLGDATLSYLRILAHGGNKDWLAAATSINGAPAGTLYLWRNPLSATTPRALDLGPVKIRGLCFDGSN